MGTTYLLQISKHNLPTDGHNIHALYMGKAYLYFRWKTYCTADGKNITYAADGQNIPELQKGKTYLYHKWGKHTSTADEQNIPLLQMGKTYLYCR